MHDYADTRLQCSKVFEAGSVLVLSPFTHLLYPFHLSPAYDYRRLSRKNSMSFTIISFDRVEER